MSPRFHVLTLIAALATAAFAQEKPALQGGVKLVRDLNYAGSSHERQTLDLYLAPDGETRPLLVWVHGGGWKAGSKLSPQIAFAAAHGYSVASLNYRYSTTDQFPAQLHDCKAAIRFLRAHAAEYHLDTTRIGVAGASAGGHLVALLGTTGTNKELEGEVGGHLEQSSAVQAVVDFYGPADLPALLHQPVPGRDRNSPDDNVSILLGDTIAKAPDKARAASAASHVSAQTPPFLVIHGDKDPKVPVQQSIDFEARLKKAGVPAELIIVPGGGHGGSQYNEPAIRERILAFFDRYVKSGKH